VALGVVLLVVLRTGHGSASIGVVTPVRGLDTPVSAYSDFWEDIRNKRFDLAWEGLSKKSQEEFAAPFLADNRVTNPRTRSIQDVGRNLQTSAFAASGEREEITAEKRQIAKEAFVKMMK